MGYILLQMISKLEKSFAGPAMKSPQTASTIA